MKRVTTIKTRRVRKDLSWVKVENVTITIRYDAKNLERGQVHSNNAKVVGGIMLALADAGFPLADQRQGK